MRNPSSYYPAPRSEDQVMKMWMQPKRAANASWGSATLLNEESSSPMSEVGDHAKFVGPSQCTWTSSSSTAADSLDDPFASKLSIATSSRMRDLPEIPFTPGGIPIDRKGSNGTDDDEDFRSSLWPYFARPGPSWDRQIAVLGETSESEQGRGRTSSLSSTASRPAPAKSILSSSASIRTNRKGRSPPSVKFVDMPTVHYEEEGVHGGYGGYGEETWPPCPVPSDPPPAGKKRGFAWFGWLAMPSSKKKTQLTVPTIPELPERPMISGPMPLWEASRHIRSSTLPRRNTPSSSARSIRSVKSIASFHSVRSCASRLQVYWGRLGGREP